MTKLLRTNSNNLDLRDLVALLDADLQVRDGDEYVFFAQFNKVDALHHVVIAYNEERAVGCGAIKEYSEGVAEVKRMFVRLESRGGGIGGKVLSELEKWAKELNYSECILETGLNQPEAIRLYEKSGYEIIPNYGQYAGVKSSVCMRKVF